MSSLDLNAPARPLAELQSQPHGYSLFASLRLLEQVFADRPRLGEARKAADDPVRLGQAPHLSFAPCDVAQLENADDGTLRLEQFAFGLFGPNGALPLHLTELAYERRRHKDDATIVDFLNLFQHRLISLFYRAWAESEPAVSLDRPDTDRFRTYIGALIGMAPESARDAGAAPDYAQLCRAGLFAAQPRSAEGLEAVLADHFGIDVEVRQFIGSWMEIPDDLRCRLGRREAATLGGNATLGAATWQCQHKFEIVLGPLPHAVFQNFLPGAPGLAELRSLLRLYTNDEWEWQVRLLLREVDIPGARLDGMSPLGWTSWLGERREHAADVVIQEAAAR